jgi:hypothetical protein
VWKEESEERKKKKVKSEECSKIEMKSGRRRK